jgi:flavin reductase (DIM6/NTAB) family NADH-FMN oxidoreductase RutF
MLDPFPTRPAVPAQEESVTESLPAHVAPRTADEASFRIAAGRFATGVTVVTTLVSGVDHAMTANAFTSVSMDPLLVLVCVENEARFHDAILETGMWAVNVLDASARPVATWLATRGRPLHGQLDRVAHRRGPVTGAALLDQSSATMECRTHSTHVAGDHTVVVGEVLTVGIGPAGTGALLYHRSGYGHLT